MEDQNPFAEQPAGSENITWDQKREMCQLANQGEAKREEFEKFVLDHVEKFDQQAWDMFLNGVEIRIQKDSVFWQKMKPFIMLLNSDTPEIGLVTYIRLSTIQTLLSELIE